MVLVRRKILTSFCAFLDLINIGAVSPKIKFYFVPELPARNIYLYNSSRKLYGNRKIYKGRLSEIDFQTILNQ